MTDAKAETAMAFVQRMLDLADVSPVTQPPIDALEAEQIERDARIAAEARAEALRDAAEACDRLFSEAHDVRLALGFNRGIDLCIDTIQCMPGYPSDDAKGGGK